VPCPRTAAPPRRARLGAHRVAHRGDDARRHRVEVRAVGHRRARERQRHVEAVAGRARDEVHVEVEHVLPADAPLLTTMFMSRVPLTCWRTGMSRVATS
jgi:hypothetical protein